MEQNHRDCRIFHSYERQIPSQAGVRIVVEVSVKFQSQQQLNSQRSELMGLVKFFC